MIEAIVAMVRNLLAAMIIAIDSVAVIAAVGLIVAIVLALSGDRAFAESPPVSAMPPQARHQNSLAVRA